MTVRSTLPVKLAMGLVAVAALASTETFAADSLKIGFPAGLTGALASVDGPTLNGAKLAISEINASGGVLGRPLELVISDTKSDTATIATEVSQMINSDHVKALVGLTDPDSVLAAAPQLEAAKIPLITPAATSPKLPAEAGTQVFLACFGDNVQAAVAAQFVLKDLHAKTGYLLTDMATEYTTLLSGYFKDAFQHGSGTLVGSDTYKNGDKNFGAQISKIKALEHQPDFLFVSSYPEDIGIILKQLRQSGVDLPVVGGDGYDTPLLLQVGGSAANNTYFTTHTFIGAGASKEVSAFIDAYQKAYGRVPENTYAALGYDSIKLLADAITRAGTDDSIKIHDALAATTGFKGITGVIGYKPDEYIPQKSVTVVGVKDTKLYLASQEAPQYVPAP